jgi:hypothetical protein
MRRLKRWALISSSLTILSCRGPEEEALSRFFAAVQAGDRATQAGMSAVAFSGPAQSWHIVEIGPDESRRFRLPELRQESEKTETERDEQFLEYSSFRRENLETLKAVRSRMDIDPDYRFTGKQGEVQAEWERFREKYEDLDRRRQEVIRRIDEELKLAKMSLMSSEEVDKFEGEVLAKDLVLSIDDGQSGEKSYRFVLWKYNLTSKQSDYRPPSRWIITTIEQL